MLGVFGMGSNGELSRTELQSEVARAAHHDGLFCAWGLTPQAREEMEPILAVVPTEASRLPVETADSEFNSRSIRNGTREVHLTPASVCIFYFRPDSCG